MSPMSIAEVPTAMSKGAFVLEKKESMGWEYTQTDFYYNNLRFCVCYGREKKEKIINKRVDSCFKGNLHSQILTYIFVKMLLKHNAIITSRGF